MTTIGKRILLVSGLGHTDLSGKVPRPGLLELRKSLRAQGHDAQVVDCSASLASQTFTPDLVGATRKIYERSVRPVLMAGSKWRVPLLAWDMSRLKKISQQIAANEKAAFKNLGQQLARQIRDEAFDAIGFPLYVGGSTIGAITIADLLRREDPTLPIFFGGPQTTHFAETIYRQTQAPTALVLGEGELSIAALADIIDSLKAGRLNDLSRIPNLVYRAEDGHIRATHRQRLSLDEWLKLSSGIYDARDFDGLMKYAFIETLAVISARNQC
jgi:hypothetical protein